MAINKKIKVSEKTVAQLRKGTMAGNLAKAKGASPEMREALTRFYGAKRVNAAIGKSTVSKFPAGKMPQPEKSKKPTIDRGMGMPKPTQAQIAAGKTATKKANNAKLTPNNREGRATVNKTTTRPSGTITGKSSTTTIKTSGGTRVNKPLINLPGMLSSSQAKLDKKSAATNALLAKNQKAIQDKKKAATARAKQK